MAIFGNNSARRLIQFVLTARLSPTSKSFKLAMLSYSQVPEFRCSSQSRIELGLALCSVLVKLLWLGLVMLLRTFPVRLGLVLLLRPPPPFLQ